MHGGGAGLPLQSAPKNPPLEDEHVAPPPAPAAHGRQPRRQPATPCPPSPRSPSPFPHELRGRRKPGSVRKKPRRSTARAPRTKTPSLISAQACHRQQCAGGARTKSLLTASGESALESLLSRACSFASRSFARSLSCSTCCLRSEVGRNGRKKRYARKRRPAWLMGRRGRKAPACAVGITAPWEGRARAHFVPPADCLRVICFRFRLSTIFSCGYVRTAVGETPEAVGNQQTFESAPPRQHVPADVRRKYDLVARALSSTSLCRASICDRAAAPLCTTRLMDSSTTCALTPSSW